MACRESVRARAEATGGVRAVVRASGRPPRPHRAVPQQARGVRARRPKQLAANTHYSIHNDMHAVKLASKTRFSFICAQFHMIHDILCDVKSRALRRSVSNLLCSFI